MNEQTSKIITNVTIVGAVLIIVAILIYAFGVINKQKDLEMVDEMYIYLNESFKNENVASKSPLLGLLNFNFDDAGSISTDKLIYTNMMSSSEMNDIGINSIYKGKYGLTKSEYIQSSRYVSNPQTNCYYYQNDLKNSQFKCDSICSKSDASIRTEITRLLQWPNILPDDIDTFCVKNPLYPIESQGYFVNLTDVKDLYKRITNKDITFDSKITSNKYYEYDAYLETESLRLEDNIKQIKEVRSVKAKGDNYVVEYVALTDAGKEKEGFVTLMFENENYYVVSNEIDNDNYLN